MRETTLCYLDNGREYLMLHRTKKQNDLNGGKWIGVGGKFEPGEDAVMCMKREVFEETGLTPTKYEYRGIVTFISDEWESEHMHLFTVTGWTGEMTECDEGELAFVPKSELYTLPMWEGDKMFLDMIAHDSDFFRMTLEYHGDTLIRAELDGEVIRK